MAKYQVEKKLTKSGYPYKQKDYEKVNAEADTAEKKKYPKNYARMKKVDASLDKDEFAATISKSGKVKVNAKVPKSLREEAAYHDKIELKKLKGK